MVGQVGWTRLALYSGERLVKRIDCRATPPLFSHAWLLDVELTATKSR